MPCMKDYGKTWDYERGIYPPEYYVAKRPKYRKVANQYGVCKFVKVDA